MTTRVRSIKRTEIIHSLIHLRAQMLEVSHHDLASAIALTDRDRLGTLVAVDGHLACSWQAGAGW